VETATYEGTFFSDVTCERRRGGCWPIGGGAAAPEKKVPPIQNFFTFLNILFHAGYETGLIFMKRSFNKCRSDD